MENVSGANETRRLSAILFTDIEGYSRMMQNDERRTLELLVEHNAILMPVMEKHGGKIIKTVGDAILAVFDSCLSAVDASVEIQESLKNRALDAAKDTLRVRIGIHLGETVFRDNDVFGNGVNIAARLQPLADPGGICISQAVYDQIQNHYAGRAVRVGPVNLKNITDPVVIYRFQIEGVTEKSPRSAAPLKPALAEKGPILASVDPAAVGNEEEAVPIVTILSGSERGGDWTLDRKMNVVTVCGAAEIDCTKARFPMESEMNVVSVMAATEILIPPGVAVEVTCVPVLGAMEGSSRPAPGGPVLRIKAVVVMAALEIKYVDEKGVPVKKSRLRGSLFKRGRARKKENREYSFDDVPTATAF